MMTRCSQSHFSESLQLRLSLQEGQQLHRVISHVDNTPELDRLLSSLLCLTHSKNPAQNGCFIFLMVRPSFRPSDGIGQEEVHRQEDRQDVYLDKPKPVR